MRNEIALPSVVVVVVVATTSFVLEEGAAAEIRMTFNVARSYLCEKNLSGINITLFVIYIYIYFTK